LYDRHREAQLAADRGHLRPDKSGADDEDPAWFGGQGLLQAGRVIAGADRVNSFECGLLWVGPLSRASTSSDQQAIEPDLVAACQAHLLVHSVQTRGSLAEQPLRVDFSHTR